jgi:hypothetical protein
MKLIRAIATVLLGVGITFAGNKYYASPTGTGVGTLASPFALRTALQATGTIHAGDTLYVLEGLYRHPLPGPVSASFPNDGTVAFPVTIGGVAGSPVIVRGVGNVLLDGLDSRGESIVDIRSSYVWLWGLDIYSSDLPRVSYTISGSFPDPKEVRRGVGINVNQSFTTVGVKIINCFIHDAFVGIGNTAESSLGAEIYGCISYNNGWNGVGSDRPHGHNFYLQNYLLNERVQDNNIVWGAYENNIQAYGGDGARFNTSNFKFRRTISFSPGDGRNLLVGGANIADNLAVDSNYTYHPGTGRNFDLGWVPYGAGASGVVRDNYFVGGGMYFQSPINITFTGNYVYSVFNDGFNSSAYPSNNYASVVPSKVVVIPNRYESGRAHLAIYNGARASSVAVDLSGVLSAGESFSIWDAQNLHGAPIASGVYSGPVDIPMAAGAVEQPIGGDTQNGVRVASRPLFLAGIVKRTGLPLYAVFAGPPSLKLLSGDRVEATFTVLCEVNSYRFYLQKQVGPAWINVDSVAGRGTTTVPRSYVLVDPVRATGSPAYRIKEIGTDGTQTVTESVTIAVTYVPESPIRVFSLSQNFPNPFNPTTIIRFEVENTIYVRLEVYNPLGERLLTLKEGVYRPGVYDVTVDATSWASGTYFYSLKAGNYVAVKRFTLIK